MSIPAAYLGIILIWSTTPLAIQWSSHGLSFALAVFARMLIGVVVAALIVALWRIPFPFHARARRAYLVGGLGLFGAMALTYWGARYVHSGLISVLFGLAPLVAGILAALVLGEHSLTRLRLAGIAFGAAGLATIFIHGDSLGHEHALAGLAALVVAVFIYSACLVWLKRIGDDSPPLATTVGTLAVSLPLFALYYYVIKHLETSKVALITLITPVIALLLGHWLNGEDIGLRLWLGTGLILVGLAVHEWVMLCGLFRPVARRAGQGAG